MRTRIVWFLIPVMSALQGCGDDCREVQVDKRGATGTISYRPADGLSLFESGEVTVYDIGATAIQLSAKLTNGAGASRVVRVNARNLRSGATQTTPHDAAVELCAEIQEGQADTCMPLQGIVTARSIAQDCWTHSSGISVCAENADVSVQAETTTGGLQVKVDLTVLSAERWVPAQCSD